MQHNLRDPSRDRTHGRVYRVTYEGRPLLKPVEDRRRADREAARPAQGARGPRPLPGQDRAGRRATPTRSSPPLKTLGRRARQERPGLRAPPDSKPSGCTSTTTSSTTSCSKRVLASPDFHARAAATRVLCYWRDRVPDALELLKKLAADPYPRVRLEAVRAASFFTVPEAVEVAVDLGRAADRRLPRLHPRRDDEGARAVLDEGDRRGQADRRSPATPARGSSSDG